jgi:hypothetical protein
MAGAHAPAMPAIVPADLNGDCSVNSADLLQVINIWG